MFSGMHALAGSCDIWVILYYLQYGVDPIGFLPTSTPELQYVCGDEYLI
jgi:hypothetical protein